MQAKKVSYVRNASKHSTSPLYSEMIKTENNFDEKKTTKKANIKKQSRAYKCYASASVEILSSFNPKIQLKDTES